MLKIREKIDKILENAFGTNPMVSEDTMIYLRDAILQLIAIEVGKKRLSE